MATTRTRTTENPDAKTRQSVCLTHWLLLHVAVSLVFSCLSLASECRRHVGNLLLQVLGVLVDAGSSDTVDSAVHVGVIHNRSAPRIIVNEGVKFRRVGATRRFTIAEMRVPKSQVNVELIQREWPNLQRILASLAQKEVAQATIVRKLARYGRQNQTKKAL